jgi:hypothetical protein
VIDKLGFLVRFWELCARHATLGQPLTPQEELELLSLMQLVTTDLRMPSPGTCARPSNAIAAQLTGEGRVVSVEVRHVCAAALLLACPVPVGLHELVMVRTADAVSGVEYVLPCSIGWVFGATPYIVAAVVDGIPTRSELLALREPRAVNAFAPRLRAQLVG